MNLNSDLFLNRNFIIKRKPRINLDILNTIPKSTYSRLNILKNRYSKFPNGEYLFEDNNRMNKRKIVNNIITPSEKSYFTESNQSQINRDIYGYNNYIINKNSFNTINFTGKKSNNSKISNVSNFNYAETPNYLTTYESNSNFNLSNNISNSQYFPTNPNNSNNSINNNDARFMNMRLNFKILQQKLSHLNDIAISNGKDTFQTPYKTNNYSNYHSIYNTTDYSTNNYPIKVFKSMNINNYNNSKKLLNSKQNEGTRNKNIFMKKDLLNRIKMKKNKTEKINNNNFPLNINKENDLFKIKISKNKRNNYRENRYFTNDNSYKRNNTKEESELSQIAETIIQMNKSSENFENNYYIKDKSLEISDFIPNNKINIIKNKNKKNKYILNKTEENSSDKEFNKTQNNNEPNLKLIVEHAFSYDFSNNRKNLTKENFHKINDTKKNRNNKNINIVQTNNFILHNLTDEEDRKKEENKNNINISLKKENKTNKNINEKNLEEDIENNDEDDGIINSLIATASQNIKNREENIKYNFLSEFDNNLKKEKKKNITFDDNLIYINYHQDFKVTNLHITDNEDKTINFKPKELSKIIKKLTNNNNKLKPIIINSNRINYNNIINQIKIKNTNSKINKIKTNQTIKKNIDFLKEIKQRNNSRERSQSKDKNKKKTNLTNNTINIKINKSNIKSINNKKN